MDTDEEAELEVFGHKFLTIKVDKLIRLKSITPSESNVPLPYSVAYMEMHILW